MIYSLEKGYGYWLFVPVVICFPQEKNEQTFHVTFSDGLKIIVTFVADLSGTLSKFSWDKIISVQQGNNFKAFMIARTVQRVRFSMKAFISLHVWTNHYLCLINSNLNHCDWFYTHTQAQLWANYNATIVICCSKSKYLIEVYLVTE